MRKKITKEQIAELRRLEARLDEIKEFTPEYEDILDRIAWFCVQNNISPEEYDKLIANDSYIELTIPQLIFGALGTCVLAIFTMLWLNGELWQHGMPLI